jgi:hypothetical protein
MLFRSMIAVVPLVASDIVVATGPEVSVMFVPLRVVSSRARENVTLIVLLTRTFIALAAGSEDDNTNPGTREAYR